jgi:hypothetical protein
VFCVSFRCSRSFLATAVALATTACASGSQAHPPQAEVTPNGTVTPALIQWSGSFQAIQQQAGNADAPRGRNNATGRIVLTSSSSNSLRARITLTGGASTSQYFHWALVTGRCGSPALPLLTVNQFPDISMSNGRGQVDAEVPIALPTSGTYHVDVFWTNGQDQADVMTCANLRSEARTS